MKLLLLLACAALAAFSADLSGTWQGQLGEGPSVAFSFKQSGAKLTGTAAVPQGEPIEISEGKVDGDKVFFIVNFNGMKITHEGTAGGDEFVLQVKADQEQFPAGPMRFKRTK